MIEKFSLPLFAAGLIFLSSSLLPQRVSAEEKEQTHYALLLEIEDESERDELLDMGVDILYERGNLLLAFVPRSALESRAVMRRFPDMDSGTRSGGDRIPPLPVKRNIPAMDVARTWFGANRIHSGDRLPQGYDGSGVVVGLCDIGFDALHPAWLDNEGNSRVALVTQYFEDYGTVVRRDTPEEILRWRTDSKDNDHGSHVAGIMAGGAFERLPYYGMAPGAEICFSGSGLTDVGLLAGVEDIVAYARSQGKPAVINLSMGNYTGPHDGSSLFSQYLDRIGEEAIIILSSGNAGNSDFSMTYTHTAEAPEFGFRIAGGDWTNVHPYGMTDIWSDTDSPREVRIGLYDANTWKFAGYLTDWIPATEQTLVLTDTDESSDFGKYFTGYLRVVPQIYRHNGRFNIAMDYDFEAFEMQPGTEWARYTITVEVRGPEGAFTNVFSDGAGSFLRQFRGPAPDTSFSVSDLACGENLVCVGMYNSRSECPVYGIGTVNIGSGVGEVNVNSSYGTLLDGRVLPHTCAPGNPIVSSLNGAAIEEYGVNSFDVSSCVKTSKGDAWYGYKGGTSMSSPYVAGVVATWLQANPDLSIGDVKEIIARTNREAPSNPEDRRNGGGWFDPYAGLLEAMALGSVESGETLDAALPQLTLTPEGLRVWTPAPARLKFYDLSGCSLPLVDGQDATGIQLPAGHTLIPMDSIPRTGGVRIARVGPTALKIVR